MWTILYKEHKQLINYTFFESFKIASSFLLFFKRKISLNVLANMWLLLGLSLFIVSYDGPVFDCLWLFSSSAFSHQTYLQTCQWSVNNSKIDQSATCFWAAGGFVYFISRPSFLVVHNPFSVMALAQMPWLE